MRRAATFATLAAAAVAATRLRRHVDREPPKPDLEWIAHVFL